MIDPDDWYPVDGLILEPHALTAIKEPRCIALIAGPGAGKTEVLAQRADFLLQTNICRYPKRVLAISFKVDACKNLKERVKQRCGSILSARFDSHTFHAFAKQIIDRFRPILTGDEALEYDYTIGETRVIHRQIVFSDLLSLAIQILKNSEIARNAIRQTYSDVFLDEFQDCTSQQYELIRLAFKDTNIRLIGVGDTKQKIMGWAGALEGIFEIFANDFSALSLNLYRNFRSHPKLLRMQNNVIKKMDPLSRMPEDLFQGDDGIIEIHFFENSQKEAQSLAEQVDFWIKEERVALSEIAVLVPKQLDLYAKLLMSELQLRCIPFRNEQQLQDICSEPIVKLIIDYLLVLCGDWEPAAYRSLLAQLIPYAIDEENYSKFQTDWQKFLKAEQQQASEINLDNADISEVFAFIKRFLKKFGKTNVVALSPEYESLERLKQLIGEAKKYISELLKSESSLIRALMRFKDESSIRIMTIHKSKGLEFDTVIILGVEKETFWANINDERCAFFVGVSRAKRRIVLTHSAVRQRPVGYSGRWEESRHPHVEFLEHARV